MRVTRKWKRIAALVGVYVALSGVIFAGLGQSVSAACEPPNIGFGRWKWCGYWYSKFVDTGMPVRPGGIPSTVNTVQGFINMVYSDVNNADNNTRTGAKFLILTQLGIPAPNPPDPYPTIHGLTQAQIDDWTARIRNFSNISENGTKSVGVNGSIDWYVNMHLACGTINSYWQPAYNDVAPYVMNSTHNPKCVDATYMDEVIIFRNTSGTPLYIVRRLCMNPIGTLQGLPNMPPNYDVNPIINTQVNGGAGTLAELGDTVKFTYSVTNGGPGNSQAATSCAIHNDDRVGYATTPSPAVNAGPTPGGVVPVCPPALGSGASFTIATETLVVTTDNRTICRSLFVTPGSLANDTPGTEQCIPVVSKPYFKAYGGDVSVGGGVETSPGNCTANASGGISSWNRRAANTYSGAGAEYAVTAMSAIIDFASGQFNTTTVAPPTSLSFANQATNVANGNFGGSYGSARCIKDYYATLPASATTIATSSSAVPAATGDYKRTGSLTLTGGSLSANEHIRLYVTGDVYITAPITYTGTWAYNQIPSFELIVKGNIYVNGSVGQLDGMYIAQKNGATGGTIYTCANAASPIALDGSLYGSCSTKLQVWGALVANSIEFLRTAGSNGKSVLGENQGGFMSEAVLYSPAMWIPQPSDGTATDYDSITSLPPVL